ncbi:unnamed protein product [Coregonus sp. 'balchen']|nr:unnamed protein product [Coregonus sp. 'balchen']
MELCLLSRIDEELDSSDVAVLCFLCRDMLNRKRLEAVRDRDHIQRLLRSNPNVFLHINMERLCEMERQGLLTEDRLDELQRTLEECDTQLTRTVRQHRGGTSDLRDRPGTEQDERALFSVFSKLGFEVEVERDLTGRTMLEVVQELGGRSHVQADALVVCVLSHGEKVCVFGTDGGVVPIRSLTRPFTSAQCSSLAGKPKLFFIQACQGKGLQQGTLLAPSIGQGERQGRYEADAGAIESVPWDADFLVGMATVEEYKSFRNTRAGSIYIQELCKQLVLGAASGEDMLSVLTRVNHEVSRGLYGDSKQMPEPKYTLTKKLFLRYP